jgi:ribosomal protein L40E
MSDELARLREALLFAKTHLSPAVAKMVGEIERGERTCMDCGAKESKRWFGIRLGLTQCMKCYSRVQAQVRKAKLQRSRL